MLRCNDQWPDDQEAFHLFIERRHRRNQSRLASERKCHGKVQRHYITSSIQKQRAARGLVNGVVYVPYSSHRGDCGTFHGWVVGVPVNNPASVRAWATTAIGGGIWGHGGVASDGTNMFVVTGNTFNTGGNWGG